jgi:hypothetical protein
MKLSDKILKDVRCGYLYSTGQLVLVHEGRHAQAGSVEWATIHDTGIKCRFTGRIILQDGAIRLALAALEVAAQENSVEHGSENTRKRNLAIGHVGFRLGPQYYKDNIYITTIDGLSSQVTYQPNVSDVFASDASTWADYRVVATNGRAS